MWLFHIITKYGIDRLLNVTCYQVTWLNVTLLHMNCNSILEVEIFQYNYLTSTYVNIYKCFNWCYSKSIYETIMRTWLLIFYPWKTGKIRECPRVNGELCMNESYYVKQILMSKLLWLHSLSKWRERECVTVSVTWLINELCYSKMVLLAYC